jgi:allophanate hydrolase subunit 2
VPADGQPVVLFVDGPTIGGYPVVGVVPRWEWPRLGQLRPGDRVAFAPQDATDARAAWVEQQRLLAAAAGVIHVDALWEGLADGAGG